MTIILWAVSRESTHEYFAAPSFEAALAACSLEGDTVRPWFFNESWHAEELPHFLECVDIAGVPQ